MLRNPPFVKITGRTSVPVTARKILIRGNRKVREKEGEAARRDERKGRRKEKSAE